MNQDDEDRIVAEIGNCFATFGGGRGSGFFNPIAEWTKDKPPMFAMGVDVRSVVQFVAMALKKPMKKPRRRTR